MTNPENAESPLEFPCVFPVKAMGRAEPGFDALVVEIVRHHVPDIREGAVSTRASKEGNWLSVTVTIEATSRAQLDAIYRSLTGHEKIVYVL
jgi:putative lipoic acid-binding regulatory protein